MLFRCVEFLTKLMHFININISIPDNFDCLGLSVGQNIAKDPKVCSECERNTKVEGSVRLVPLK